VDLLSNLTPDVVAALHRCSFFSFFSLLSFFFLATAIPGCALALIAASIGAVLLRCGSPAAAFPTHEFLTIHPFKIFFGTQTTFLGIPSSIPYSKHARDFTRPIIAATQPKSAATDYIDRFAVIYDNEEFHVGVRIK